MRMAQPTKRENVSSNVEISDSYGHERVDIIGSNKVEILENARIVRSEFMNNPENKQLVTDYIFGKSDENPLQDVTDEVEKRFIEYNDRINTIAEGVKTYMRVNKLNV